MSVLIWMVISHTSSAKKRTLIMKNSGDFRRLNAATVTDGYPILYIHNFSSKLSGCVINIDLHIARYSSWLKAYTKLQR